MHALRVLVSSNLPMVWNALCATCVAQGLVTVRVPRDRRPFPAIDPSPPTVLAVDLLDVATVDLRGEITEVCGELRSSADGPDVLLLVDGADELDPLELVRCGVRGMFTPDTDLELFPRAVRRISEGEMWWSRRQFTTALEGLASGRDEDADRGSEDPAESVPTPRERSVLLLLADGLNHLEIADALGFTAHTARTHIRNVMRKLDAHSRTEAVQVALERGLLDAVDDPAGPT